MIKEINAGKTADFDGFAVECLKSGSTSGIEWLVRLLNVCFVNNMVPGNWTSVCVVPLYKDKGS